MNNSKHTPGPWRFDLDFDVQSVTGYPIAHAKFPSRSNSIRQPGKKLEQEANARLIAAAPELLEALKNMINHVGHAPDDPLFNAAKGVIAKAEGRDE